MEQGPWLLGRRSRVYIPQVGDVSTLRNLKRLDLTQNSLQSTSFAAFCTGLKWLSLAHNPVSDLSPLSCLQSLQAGSSPAMGLSISIMAHLSRAKSAVPTDYLHLAAS